MPPLRGLEVRGRAFYKHATPTELLTAQSGLAYMQSPKILSKSEELRNSVLPRRVLPFCQNVTLPSWVCNTPMR